MTVRTEIFATKAVLAPSRVAYWNDVATSILGAIAIRPAAPEFNGLIKRRHFGEMQFVQIQSTPVSVCGEHDHSARGIYLLANRRGSCRLSQGKRETWLRPGELTALRSSEPYRIEFGQAHETLILHVPAPGDGDGLDAHIAVAHPADGSQLLVSYMHRLCAMNGMERGPANLARTTRDLLELTWPRPRANVRRESAAAWEQRILRHVESHLDDPELGAAAIAANLGISTRYVHAIFARLATTASAHILENRLERAAARLRKDAEARICDIAFATGFNDLSHFCRSFRQRFGLSAREFRAMPISGSK